MASPVCKLKKYGYCNFNKNCFYRHVDTKCDDQECNIHLCENRHPRDCRNWQQFSSCRFGQVCAFVHVQLEDVHQGDHRVLELKVVTLEALILEKENQIKTLVTKLEELEAVNINIAQFDGMNDFDTEYSNDEEGAVLQNCEVEEVSLLSEWQEEETFIEDTQENIGVKEPDETDDSMIEAQASPYKCNVCRKRTETVESMKDHIRIQHVEYLSQHRNDPEVP